MRPQRDGLGLSGTAAAKAEYARGRGVALPLRRQRRSLVRSSRDNVTVGIGPVSARSVAAPGRFCHHWPVSERIREHRSPDGRRPRMWHRATIRVRVPSAMRVPRRGVEAAFAVGDYDRDHDGRSPVAARSNTD